MRQIWFRQTGKESALRRPYRAVNGYSSRPGTKPIHPQRHLEKGERGKRWRGKNMHCCLFLAAGINYSAKGRDRLTLAILFLVPLMTVVVNIHRQTPCLSLCSPSPPPQWQKYFNSFSQKICLSPRGAADPPQQCDSCIRILLPSMDWSFSSPPLLNVCTSQCPFDVPVFVFLRFPKMESVFVGHHFSGGCKSHGGEWQLNVWMWRPEFARSTGDVWPWMKTKAQNLYPYMFKWWPDK